METLYINEMLRTLFLFYKNDTRLFISLFNQSKTIAAFDYDILDNSFTWISHSFYMFLGMNLNREQELSPEKILHPDDLGKFNTYFNTNQYFINPDNLNKTPVFNRMKCRLLHAKGYWKNFIFISFNLQNSNALRTHKIGFILEENPHATFLRTDKNDTVQMRSPSDNPDHQLNITKREGEILEYLAQGLIAKEIAKKLNISVTTVISHKKNLIEKFQVKNTTELIRKATMLKIV